MLGGVVPPKEGRGRGESNASQVLGSWIGTGKERIEKTFPESSLRKGRRGSEAFTIAVRGEISTSEIESSNLSLEARRPIVLERGETPLAKTAEAKVVLVEKHRSKGDFYDRRMSHPEGRL